LLERNANSRTTLKGSPPEAVLAFDETKANALRVFLAALHFIKVLRQRWVALVFAVAIRDCPMSRCHERDSIFPLVKRRFGVSRKVAPAEGDALCQNVVRPSRWPVTT
jgi:hypothetical protein